VRSLSLVGKGHRLGKLCPGEHGTLVPAPQHLCVIDFVRSGGMNRCRIGVDYRALAEVLHPQPVGNLPQWLGAIPDSAYRDGVRLVSSPLAAQPASR
jgi:hypothetical protein